MKVFHRLAGKNKVPVKDRDLLLKNTLINGQAFNWQVLDSVKTRFQGVLMDYFVEFIQKDGVVMYYNYPEDDIEELLNDYFQMSHDYDELIKQWSEDQYF